MTRRLSPARTIALFVVVLAFVALSVFALMARSYEPGRPALNGNAIALLPPRVAAAIAASTALPPGSPAVAVGTGAADDVGTARQPSRPPAASSPATDARKPLAPCELGLAVPTEQAGVANLTPLVPLFGPFSPEAFAMVPAFAPGFGLFGPLIIAGGDFLSANPALTSNAYDVVHPLEMAGFDAISPVYAPARPRVLEGEAAAAAVIAPQVERFASLPGATCLPAVLALLVR